MEFMRYCMPGSGWSRLCAQHFGTHDLKASSSDPPKTKKMDSLTQSAIEAHRVRNQVQFREGSFALLRLLELRQAHDALRDPEPEPNEA